MHLFENIPYGEHERHVVDITLPDNPEGVKGLVFFIHGGGWNALDKELHREDLVNFVALGFAAAATNYRYVDDNTRFADELDDITASLKTVKTFAAEKGIALEKALFFGGSAGGHLALMYAYSRAYEAPIKPVCVTEYFGPTDLADRVFYNNGGIDGWIGSAVSQGIGMHMTDENFDSPGIQERLKAASPLTYLSADCVPTFIIHGMADTVVPFEHSVRLERELRGLGVKTRLIALPLSGHGVVAPEDEELNAQGYELFRQCALDTLR